MPTLKEMISEAIAKMNNLTDRFSQIADEFQSWGTGSGYVTIHDAAGVAHSVPGINLMRGLYTNVYSVMMYVATSGSDTTGNGIATKPFKTLDYALSRLPVLVPGRAIIRISEAGSYPLTKVITNLNCVLEIQGKDVDGELLDSAPIVYVEGSSYEGTFLYAGVDVTFTNIAIEIRSWTGSEIPIIVGMNGKLAFIDSDLTVKTAFGAAEVITLHSEGLLTLQKVGRVENPLITGLANKRFCLSVAMNRLYVENVDFDVWDVGFTLSYASKLIIAGTCNFDNCGNTEVVKVPTSNSDCRGNETDWGQFAT